MTSILPSADIAAPNGDPADAGMRDGRRFLDAVSDEVRQPMNAILAVAELLARQPLSHDAQAYVRTIIDHSHSLLRSIEDARDLVSSEHAESGAGLAARVDGLHSGPLAAQGRAGGGCAAGLL